MIMMIMLNGILGSLKIVWTIVLIGTELNLIVFSLFFVPTAGLVLVRLLSSYDSFAATKDSFFFRFKGDVCSVISRSESSSRSILLILQVIFSKSSK